jgi:hypothetical protein
MLYYELHAAGAALTNALSLLTTYNIKYETVCYFLLSLEGLLYYNVAVIHVLPKRKYEPHWVESACLYNICDIYDIYTHMC